MTDTSCKVLGWEYQLLLPACQADITLINTGLEALGSPVYIYGGRWVWFDSILSYRMWMSTEQPLAGRLNLTSPPPHLSPNQAQHGRGQLSSVYMIYGGGGGRQMHPGNEVIRFSSFQIRSTDSATIFATKTVTLSSIFQKYPLWCPDEL
jgi:hypothetical protein